jgi:SnoaL-like domain
VAEDIDIDRRLDDLEKRLAVAERNAQESKDRLDVLNLVAAHAYLLDSFRFDKRAAQFDEGAVFELIPMETFPSEPDWRETSAADVEALDVRNETEEWHEEMRAAGKRGLTHFPSIVHVEVDGDTATAFQHIAVFERDPTAEPLDVPPHGVIRGFRCLMVSVNHFDCRRVDGTWKIARRNLRVNTGQEARRVLGDWAETVAV